MDENRYRGLLDDLHAEGRELTAVLSGLTDEQWSLGTPAQGWTIHDQVEHLAFFDDMARLALMHPAEFVSGSADVVAVGTDWIDRVSFDRRSRPAPELLLRFERLRASLLETLVDVGPDCRAPWFGPTMSAASSATARLMETWAHSQDVHDALGVTRLPSERIRHVCHLGVLTRGFSFRINGLQPPTSEVRVELVSPDGEVWTWGAEGAGDQITGDAADFALVVTQRRAWSETNLQASAGSAVQWLDIAQAFAGNPPSRRSSGDA